MVEVIVRTYRRARPIIGTKELRRSLRPGANVDSLLNNLAEEYELDPTECIVLVNGRHASLIDGGNTPLADGDEVAIAVDPSPD